MKKLIYLIAGVLLYVNSFAQSNVKGRFSLSAGFDIGAHYTQSESKYQGNIIDQDTSGAVTKLFQFNAHYSFAKWFSAGIGIRNGSYVEDPNSTNAKFESNTISEFYLDTRFYYVNKDKLNLYAGLSIGSNNLHIDYANVITIDYYYKATTSRLTLFGMNWYLSKYVGLWCNIDYASRKYLLHEYKLNGSSQNLTDYNFKLNTKGGHLAFGACFKFK